jgi:hypothetical protein
MIKEIGEEVKKIKCPICKSKMLDPKDNNLDYASSITKGEFIVLNAESWCAKDPSHYRMVFEWFEPNYTQYHLVIEDVLLFDDDYEYTIERYLIGKKLNIITKSIYENEDDKIMEIPDPGISLRKLTLKKLYTLLTFR